MSEKPLKVAFIWHMHQPYYKEIKTNRYLLPWVRLHALKDYYDMVAILDHYPEIFLTFNLVPSLVEQLKDYASNSVYDKHLFLTEKKAAELNPEEKLELVRDFFLGNQATMIKPYPRFYQLYLKRGDNPEKFNQTVQGFTNQDLLDLQIWSNLVWFDPSFRKDKELASLYKKKENFTEEDKKVMLSKQKDIIRLILPKYKELKDKGQIEITISPYYHPIMPLLCDTEVARISQPNINLPKRRFIHPEDAQAQINSGINSCQEVFGGKPKGIWPSEGGVSEEIVPLMAQAGIEWTASDEEILYLCLDSKDISNHDKINLLYKPYEVTVKGHKLVFFFRDHLLSDLIGFTYSQWNPQKAAKDFISRLLDIRRNLKEEELDSSVVSIILDGENCWEYYQNDGLDFLNALYSGLSSEKSIQTTTISKFLTETQVKAKLSKLYPGSWIDHNFKIWIGGQEDNLAWDLLSETRDKLVEIQEKNKEISEEKIKAAWKEIYIAEGSDWCWWYGGEHFGPGSELFDLLFRSHLLSVYELLDSEPPKELFQPLRSGVKISALQEQTCFITPTLDGKVTHYYEWEGAGALDCVKLSGAIRRAVSIIKQIYFAHDSTNLYLRVDTIFPIEKYFTEDYQFEFEILKPLHLRLPISREKAALYRFNPENKQWGEESTSSIDFKFAKILELSLPLSIFDLEKDKDFQFRLIVKKGEVEVERCPEVDLIKFSLLEEEKSTIYW
jgi:alpha-amylase/alpha-mannosidase (GH57 family)